MNYSDILSDIYRHYCFQTIMFELLLILLFFSSIIYTVWLYKKRKTASLTNKYKKRKKTFKPFDASKEKSMCITKCVLFSIVFVIFGILILYQFSTVSNDIVKDIDSESFVTYEGEFYIKGEPHHSFLTKRNTMVVLSENISKIPYERNNYYDCIFRDSGNDEYNPYNKALTRGNHYGTLVYGMNSKTIVFIDLEPKE